MSFVISLTLFTIVIDAITGNNLIAPGLEWYIPGLEIELCSRDGCSDWLGLCNRVCCIALD